MRYTYVGRRTSAGGDSDVYNKFSAALPPLSCYLVWRAHNGPSNLGGASALVRFLSALYTAYTHLNATEWAEQSVSTNNRVSNDTGTLSAKRSTGRSSLWHVVVRKLGIWV